MNHFILSAGLALAGLVFTASTPAQTVLESVQVPASGDPVTFTNRFERGEMYLLKATGSVSAGSYLLDAKYEFDGRKAIGTDAVSGKDVGIDTGLPAGRAPAGAGPKPLKWFGDFRTDHTYYLLATGTGRPLTLKLITGGQRGGTGAITVSLYPLSPAPAALPDPLETLPVSVLAETELTTMTTRTGVVYLLQAAGDGHVGGGGLGRGDAEYMDYRADGSGCEDIGDNNIDYGLGVDETDTAKSPRKNWWGPFRQDHIYYQLFTGTGAPIHFYYYDSNYGDNSATDHLTVRVFPVP
jgi:hypothetical protein